MKKSFFAFATCAILLSANSFADLPCFAWQNDSECIWGTDDVANGANCQIKNVVLLAKSQADCKAAGGKVLTQSKK